MARQVALGHVAGHDRARAEADAREEHLHLLDGRVLRLVEDDEGLVQRASAHVGERRDLDDVALDELRNAVEAEHLVEGVVDRAQVGIDLLREVARQEAEPLARLDRGANEHETAHAVALQRLDGARDREIGLAGARRADAEVQVDRLHVAQILLLVRTPRAHEAAARLDRDLVVRTPCASPARMPSSCSA